MQMKSNILMQFSPLIDHIKLIPLVLFVYGFAIGPVRKCLHPLSKFCYLCILLVLTYRICNLHILFPKNSIIKVAAYLSDLIILLIHLTILFYIKRIKKYFSTFVLQEAKSKKFLKIIDLIFLIAFLLCLILNLFFYFISQPFGTYQSDGIKFVFSIFAYSISDSYSIPHAFIYAVAVTCHYFNLIAKLNQMSTSLRFNNSSKLIRIIGEIDQIHFQFESTFSFFPFALVMFNWFQGFVYAIGAAFNNRAGQWFDWFTPAWSIHLQMCTFAVIIFAVTLNNRFSLRVNCFISQLESEFESSDTETLHLASRLRLLTKKPFTAWHIFELKYTFIYPYISSLVSFSLLFLQLELRLPEQLINCPKWLYLEIRSMSLTVPFASKVQVAIKRRHRWLVHWNFSCQLNHWTRWC